jgi:hypothetical protein
MLASELQTAFALYKQDTSDVSDALFIQWCDYINQRAYLFLRDQAPERYITSQNYTVSTTPSSQALPATFQDMNVTGCGFFELDSLGNPTERRLIMTGYGSTETGFYLDGTNVNFTGINTSTTYAFRFIPVVAALTALTNSLVIPDRFLLYARDAIDTMYNQWDEDRGAESFADARFVRDLDEILRNIRLQPNVFAMYNNSSSY